MNHEPISLKSETPGGLFIPKAEVTLMLSHEMQGLPRVHKQPQKLSKVVLG
jgi:hypothetical protein